jgi:hypothetical protein
MVVRWRDLFFAVKVPPCGVCRMRRLTVLPCNTRRGVMGRDAKAAQAIPGILVQVQIQLVDVLVGCAVTGEDQLRKFDCAKVECGSAARDAVIKYVSRDVQRQTRVTHQDPLTRRARSECLVHGAKSVSSVRNSETANDTKW